MKRMCNFFSAAVLGYLLVGGVTFAQEAEESKISSSSQEFVAAGDTDLAKLEASELSDALETGSSQRCRPESSTSLSPR